MLVVELPDIFFLPMCSQKLEFPLILPREAAILVSPTSIQKGDTGSVIVGGRMFSTQKPQESFKR